MTLAGDSQSRHRGALDEQQPSFDHVLPINWWLARSATRKFKTSQQTSDVLLPGIATCQKCHDGGRNSAGDAASSAMSITTGAKAQAWSTACPRDQGVFALGSQAEGLRHSAWRAERRVRHRIEIGPVAQVQPLHFLAIERP